MLKKFAATIILTIFASIVFSHQAFANSVGSIDKTVTLNSDGSAHVTEIWQADLTRGTEGYEAFSDLKGKTIENFTVADDSGTTYEPQETWDAKATFAQKAFKNGINYTSDGLELCWGISEYGHRTYILDYDIINLVTLYADGIEGIHFNFLKLDQYVDSASVTVKMADDTPLSLENSRIWGFGYTGENSFADDGTLKFVSTDTMSSDNYMILLVRFQTSLFNDETLIKSDQTFDDIYEDALRNSEYAKQREIDRVNARLAEDRRRNRENAIIRTIFLAPIFGYLFIAGFRRFLRRHHKIRHAARPANCFLNDITPTREIPCNKNIFEAFYLMDAYHINLDEKRKLGLVGALFLKLILEKKIVFEKQSEHYWQSGRYNYRLNVANAASSDPHEQEFIDLLQKAAGNNGLLEADEFKKWSRRHYQKIVNWFNHVIKSAKSSLDSRKLRTNSSALKDEAKKLSGLKSYLGGLSTFRTDLGVDEAVIWEEYLIFAELLGVSEKIREEFRRLYPKIYQEFFLSSDEFWSIDDFVDSLNAGIVASSIASAPIVHSSSGSSDSYSGSSGWSGGGGSSSSSGGGSSGGSSGGGFR